MLPVFIVAIVFSFVALMVKMSYDFQRDKIRLEEGTPEDANSLGTSELQELIAAAVSEALEPLLDRIDTLETTVTKQLEAPGKPLLLEPGDDGESAEDLAGEAYPNVRRTRTR